MFIVVEHIITDPKGFWGVVPKVVQTPEDVKVVQSYPSISSDRAVCLWDAASVEKVKAFLEPLTAQFSRNTYYAVDTTNALGLPTIAAKAA